VRVAGEFLAIGAEAPGLSLEVDDSLSDSLVLGRGDFEYVVADRARLSFRGLVGHELNSGLRHLDGHGVDDHATRWARGR
jgi:hypothetical protein